MTNIDGRHMKAVIIGGGRGCKAIIELAGGTFLKELTLEILCVADPDPKAPGIMYARRKGIPTTQDMKEALSIPDIKLIMELTGRDEVLEDIYKMIPRGIKVFDHVFSRIFWELAMAQKEQNRQLREITELEQNIEKERRFLQILFDKIPELVAVLDKDKKIVKINDSFASFTGLTADQVIGGTCVDVFSGTELNENCRQTVHLLDEVIESGEPSSLIWQSPPPNETFWEVTQTPIKNSEGETEGILGTWHRITDQVILQRKIESAELRFKSFIDSAHDWISVKDLEGKYMIVNKIVAESFHLQPEDFIGKRPEEVIPKDLAELIKSHDNEVIRDDRYHAYDEIIPFDGRDHHFQTVRFPLKDYKGSIKGTCTIMRDVSAEIELKEQLIQAGKLAAVGKLAAGVAHEINNPLTGVLAYAEDMVDDLPNDDPHQEDLRVIIRETLRCRDIVRNLLDFARQETPKLEKLHPNLVIDQSISLIEKLPQFRDIKIEVEKSDTLPSILGDPHQLQQVVLNFLMNSTEAMKGKGTIKLSTRFESRDNRCQIVVEDNGPGIPENIIDKIFEPFFSTKGTNGLGLAVSWGIVERHHGKIEVEMSESGGALFRIVLPVYYGESAI
jgi:two-component system NtrC family sensor kinase